MISNINRATTQNRTIAHCPFIGLDMPIFPVRGIAVN
jgi:hypothetical protein